MIIIKVFIYSIFSVIKIISPISIIVISAIKVISTPITILSSISSFIIIIIWPSIQSLSRFPAINEPILSHCFNISYLCYFLFDVCLKLFACFLIHIILIASLNFLLILIINSISSKQSSFISQIIVR